MMAKMKKNKIWEYVPLVLTFVILFVFFFVAFMTMRDKDKDRYTMDKVSAFDLDSQSAYSFVEVEGSNGLKYYVITKNNESTAAVSQHPVSSTSQTQVTVPAVASTRTTTTQAPTTLTTAETPSETTAATTASQTESKQKIAYLTFDDGPSENTGRILDILDQYNVKATFFVIYHKNMESEYQEIVNRGHTIALHSYTHNYKTIYSSEDAYFDDLQKIHDYVQDVTGVDSHIIRFPGGSSNTISNKYCKGIMKKLKKDVLDKGYIYHDWNVDSTDAAGNNRSTEVLLKNVKKDLNSYRTVDILMHDTGAAKETTVQALPSIIEYVRSQGFEMEAISEESKAIRHGW